MKVEKFRAENITDPKIISDITVFRNYWDPTTLEIFKTYYVTHVYRNLPALIEKNIGSANVSIDHGTSQTITSEDYISTNRLWLGKDSMSMIIMNHILEFLIQYLGLKIIPGYSYPALHLPGSILREHVDKEIGEYVVSMPLYTENLRDPWPFIVGGQEILLEPGDFVLYDGQIPHKRSEPLLDNTFSINLFLLFTHEHSTRSVEKYKKLHAENKSFTSFIFPGNIGDFISKDI
jgi:hypothetical protein